MWCWQAFPAAVAAAASEFEEDELDDEELGHAETYADYMPAKCKPCSRILTEMDFYFHCCLYVWQLL